jgi:hypothetical protein
MELDRIEQSNDVGALGTPEQRDQWQRILRIEAALAAAPNDEENNAAREKARLVKGVLYWQLAESFKARVWNQRRTIRDLDQALREAENRWVRVQKARSTVPTNTGEFDARLGALKQRLDTLTVRLVDMQARQNDLLEGIAIRQLTAQKERLDTYQIQARFELATIYDRVANPPTPAGSSDRKRSESAPAESAPAESAPTETTPGDSAPEATPPESESAPPPPSATLRDGARP